MSLPPGSEVSHYRLERLLGSGGMGDVYLGRDTQLDRLVAIKFLTAPSDTQARRRLLREARAVAALDHRGICAVYEVGADPLAGDFIAMQYLEGETLAARLKRGRMRPDEALVVCGQIADALMTAHKGGIVHRDLKPQNIIMSPSGPKLLDFGLATQAPNTAAAANAITTSQVTDPHTVVGTPAYMAPEQVRNDQVDFRSDIFALGAVLYECLTGRRAFSGATTAETLGNVLHIDPPPVSSLAPDAGPAYDGLCARMLHKIPDERFQSAEEVLGAIRALTPSSRLPAPNSAAIVVRPRPRAGRRVVTAAVVLIAVMAGYKYWPRGAALPVAPADAARYHDIGVDAIRAGTFVTARSAFQEAIRLFPSYPQAYARLAEADIALDDERGAERAMLQVSALVPDQSRLSADDQLRFEAARAAALRQYPLAIAAYRKLADLKPADAGRWLDVGRVEEAASHVPEARDAYARAVSLDAQSAAAHLRLGVLQTKARQTDEGLASIDEAMRLYHAVTNTEGEMEGLLVKGRALRGVGRSDAARAALDEVVRRATDPRLLSQRVSAQVELALLEYVAGHLANAEALATQAVDDAKRADLPTVAARGLFSVAVSLLTKDVTACDTYLTRAIELANLNGATRIEMRARLQQAYLRQRTDQPEQAIALAEAPEKYFTKSGEKRNLADVKLIKARAYEDLDRVDEARASTEDVVAIATETRDDLLLANAVENLAGQLIQLGRLPEALAQRERLEELHRKLKDQSALPDDLLNRAELLILLGRRTDAAGLLRDIEDHVARAEEPFLLKRAALALNRGLLAATERRWSDVGPAVAAAIAALPRPAPGSTPRPTYTELFGRVLAEHALAQLGRSRVAPAELAKWPAETRRPIDRREFSFWVAQILLARREQALAGRITSAALADKVVLANPELSWRLSAVAAEAARTSQAPAEVSSFMTQARTSVTALKTAWAGAADAYLARPDLAVWVKSTQ
ncbi:MAG TPA: protein kinase [Vicinamibacterales bacterium]|nr:protein kinase [Vicinamibacterales bacterium]